MEVRHQVVDAIVEAFTTDDPSALPPGATAAERAAADVAIGRLLERRPGRADPRQRITKLLFRAYRSGDDWTDLFDRLTPFEVAELRELFPFMPSRAARFFAERFLFPTT